MKIVELDKRSSALGLFIGQNLSDARAIVTDLDAREIDRETTARVFADFADWHSTASPIVSIVTDVSPWGDLALDITGVSHLFGGEAQMIDKLMGRLATLGYSVTGAVASTLGCAWALVEGWQLEHFQNRPAQTEHSEFYRTLSICGAVVRGHGGRLLLESAPTGQAVIRFSCRNEAA